MKKTHIILIGYSLSELFIAIAGLGIGIHAGAGIGLGIFGAISVIATGAATLAYFDKIK